MAFIQPCFIRKNTPELRKQLEELGYLPPSKVWYDKDFAICTAYRDNNGDYFTFKIDEDFERIIAPSYPYIDCGTNEDLFLSIAALRDDTDKWQLFIFDGIDVPDYFLQKGDMWICSLDKHLVENCHKATVEELIEYFKEE